MEKTSKPRKERSTFLYYKSPNTLISQGTHNLPILALQSCSNLTFGGYLAGATLVLFARSSLFMLCWCFEYVRTVQFTVDFSASSVGPVYGKCAFQPITSQTKSCMELTRLMATTNNVQRDELRPSALERLVQTLTAIVERLTKLNQDLDEQLRQKNAAMGT